MNSFGIEDLIEKIIHRTAKESAESEQSAARDLVERAESFARQAALRQQESENEAAQLKLLGEVARIARQRAEIDERLQHAEDHLQQLRGEKLNISFKLQREEAILCATYSPLLLQFETRINTEIERLHKLKPETQTGFGEKDLYADHPKTPRLTYSNVPAIGRRLRALFSARAYVEQLKVQDRSEADLQKEIADIWENLPTIESLELVDRI